MPSEREEKAVKRGADELMNLCEWHFRKRPRVLARLRQAYRLLCLRLYCSLERSYRAKNGNG
jgi:hypothetical protein